MAEAKSTGGESCSLHLSNSRALFVPVAALHFVLFLLLCGAAQGRQSYQSLIPNGDRVYRNGQYWGGVGHQDAAGGGPYNLFGTDFANSFDWPTVCPLDSDGDSYTNGMELGDPQCTWTQGSTPSRTTGITHPGFADSFPSTPATQPPATPHPPPTTKVPATPPPPPIANVIVETQAFSVLPGLSLNWTATPKFVYVTQYFQVGAYASFAASSSGMNGMFIFASMSSSSVPRCALYSGRNYDVSSQADQTGVAVLSGSVTGTLAKVTCNVSRSVLGIVSGSSQRMIFAVGSWVGVPLQHAGSGKISATVNIDAGTLTINSSSKYLIGWGVMIALFGLWMIAGFFASKISMSLTAGRIIQSSAALSIFACFIAVFLAYRADYVVKGATDGDARSFGWAACAGFAMVLLPTAKHAAISRVFGSAFERTLWIHPLIGFLIFIAATTHMGIMYNMDKSSVSGQVAWALLAVMVIIGATRQYWYRLFRYTHFIFILVLLVVGLHVGTTFLWIVLPGVALYVVDLVLRIRTQVLAGPKLVSLRNVLGNSTVTEVEVAVDWKEPPIPGQYCFLGVSPGIAHPFSVASYDGQKKKATFYCKAVGPTTLELASLAEAFTSDMAGKSVVCLGPYGSPQFDLATVEGLLLIAGGIGITPILYTLQWLSSNTGSLKLKRLVVVWSAREEPLATSLQPFIDSQLRLISAENVTTHTHIMVTAQSSASPTIRVGRPNLAAITDELSKEMSGEKIGLFCCGPQAMMDACTDAAAHNNFLLHKETFSF